MNRRIAILQRMMRASVLLLVALSTTVPELVLAAPPAKSAAVSMDVIMDTGLPLTAPQEWSRVLSELGIVGLRMHSGEGGKLGIENRGTKQSPAYHVTAQLKADNLLYLPGGKFGPRDAQRLRDWVDKLKRQGEEGVTSATAAFGLLPSQLKRVQNDLKKPVGFATTKLDLREAIDRLRGKLEFPLAIDAAAAASIDDVTVAEDLSEFSRGTALAVMLRPAGLVLLPEPSSGGEARYRIARPTAGRDAWPLGWKPDRPARELVPDLFVIINVEFPQVPASEALASIAERLKVPFLYDHNAIALYDIDLNEILVDVPSKKLSYSQTLSKVLLPARMKYELRVDEAGKPFIWLTSIKPVR